MGIGYVGDIDRMLRPISSQRLASLRKITITSLAGCYGSTKPTSNRSIKKQRPLDVKGSRVLGCYLPFYFVSTVFFKGIGTLYRIKVHELQRRIIKSICL